MAGRRTAGVPGGNLLDRDRLEGGSAIVTDLCHFIVGFSTLLAEHETCTS
ncbi:MAG: hypothetical protein WCF90_04525 [Methanomicrobiales archaeon]